VTQHESSPARTYPREFQGGGIADRAFVTVINARRGHAARIIGGGAATLADGRLSIAWTI
jgi:hypothetical protein